MVLHAIFRLGGTVALTTVLCASTAILPAMADPGNEGKEVPPFANPEGSHCVVEAAATKEAAKNVPATCFPTFRKSIAFATRGRITDAPENAAEAVRDPQFIARVKALSAARDGIRDAEAATILEIIYQLPQFGGESRTVTAPSDCDSGSTAWLDLSGTWWDNRTSSAVNTSGYCWATHWQYVWSGSNFALMSGLQESDFGSFDNRTTSIEYSADLSQ